MTPRSPQAVLENSVQVRRTAIAYLFQNAIPLERSDNLQFYDEVNKEGVDFPEMQQQPGELILLQRGPGDHLAEVRVGRMELQGVPPGVTVQPPFRFLFAEQGGSKPVKIFEENADTLYEAFRKVWGGRLSRLQLVEVSQVASVQVNQVGGAPEFVRNHVTQIGDSARNHLARDFQQYALKLSSGLVVVHGGGKSPVALPGASVDITMETSPQDPRLLVLTSLVKWNTVQLRLSEAQLPPEARSALGGEFLELNVQPQAPNVYVSQVYNFLQQNVLPFLSATAR